ncbi:hypothetical protein OXYTRIMIC_489 [Oxytricha trifallax]|uniref:Uncharacterized protein n=1 Tax=Oxytricha trifallax TaxID=1172189 RepID=A0A073HX83_9SPIT|nr:hypothetical protein OXYTRIMIC_489 [Oxytricha trifallax]
MSKPQNQNPLYQSDFPLPFILFCLFGLSVFPILFLIVVMLNGQNLSFNNLILDLISFWILIILSIVN